MSYEKASEISDDSVRAFYVGGRDEYDPNPVSDERMYADFDAWLARVRRDAWEEGAQYGALSPGYYPDENPYGYEEAE